MNNTCLIRITICGAFACLLTAAEPARSGDDVILVEIDGQKLTLADLEAKNAAALFQARTNYYEAQRKALDGLLDNYLLERAAAKEGITVPQLLDLHVNSTIAKDPPEDTLRVYYEGLDTAAPYEAVRDKIIESLRQRRTAKARATYLQSLRTQASIVLRLPPPRAMIAMKGVPVRGAVDPRVTFLEYADYECPVCQQIQPVVDKLEAEFKDKVAFAFKDFPLNMHPDAQKAAEAARCAGAQGKYWEYHDALFSTRALAPAALKGHARDLKLDTKAFDTCLDTGAMADPVKDEFNEAVAFGLQGTPTFLVNGRFVSGAMTYEKLRAVIAEELSAALAAAEAEKNAPSSRSGDRARIP